MSATFNINSSILRILLFSKAPILIMAGAKIYNLQESLVSVRMGNEQQMRRGGFL
jgi:hypothetical protein